MRAGFCRKPLNQGFEQQTEDEPTQLRTGAPRSGNQGVTARPVRDPGGCSRPDRSSSYFEDQTENKIQGRALRARLRESAQHFALKEHKSIPSRNRSNTKNTA